MGDPTIQNLKDISKIAERESKYKLEIFDFHQKKKSTITWAVREESIYKSFKLL